MENVRITIENPETNNVTTIDIEQLILERKKTLLKKKKEIDRKCKSNEFLKMVADDYATYNSYILEEKRTQYQSLQQLNNHLIKLKKENANLNKITKNAKDEETEILLEMERLRQEMDKLTNK